MTERETIDALENRLSKIGTMVTRLATKMFMTHSNDAAYLVLKGE
jgi:hypothetical protein